MYILYCLGEKIHYRDFNNGNALYWAVVSGKVKIFQDLVDPKKAAIDPLMRTRKNETLLHVAAMLGMAEFIPEILKHGVDPWFEDSTKKTALDRHVHAIKSCRSFQISGRAWKRTDSRRLLNVIATPIERLCILLIFGLD